MTQILSDIRGRIHRKSNNYFTFDYSRRDRNEWHMFYGATDALLDASMAATAFGRAVRSDPAIDLLVCYGFLQAIYIQQDSVWTLSRVVGLEWHPNDDPRLKEIRDIRNRLTGHPAFAAKNQKRFSSAIISYHDIRANGFPGTIYFDDGTERIQIDVALVLKDNEERLASQLQKVEDTMDDQERCYRTEQAKSPLSVHFGTGFDYLVQRLWCDLSEVSRVIQAETHAKMIRKQMLELQNDLDARGFGSEATSYHLSHIFTALDFLEKIIESGVRSQKVQEKFDLIFDGFDKNQNVLKAMIHELDVKLNSPV